MTGEMFETFQALPSDVQAQVDDLPLASKNEVTFWQAQIDTQVSELRDRARREATVLVSEESALETRLAEGWTDLANAHAALTGALALGEKSWEDVREEVYKLDGKERDLIDAQSALVAKSTFRERMMADPVAHFEAMYRRYPTLPRPQWKRPR